MKKETGKQVVKKYNKPITGDLIGDIRSLIETARQNVAAAVNAGLAIPYPDRKKSRLLPWMNAVEVLSAWSKG